MKIMKFVPLVESSIIELTVACTYGKGGKFPIFTENIANILMCFSEHFPTKKLIFLGIILSNHCLNNIIIILEIMFCN